MSNVMTDGEIEVYLHDLARKEELEANLRHAQTLRQIGDRFAELAEKDRKEWQQKH